MATGRSWDIVVPITKKDDDGKPVGKTYWHRIGIAFEGRKAGSFSLTFNSLPLSPNVFLFERTEEWRGKGEPAHDDHAESKDDATSAPEQEEIPF